MIQVYLLLLELLHSVIQVLFISIRAEVQINMGYDNPTR